MAGLHASRDSVYLAEGDDKTDPGWTAFPLQLLPRRCPLCGDDTIIGHGQRRKAGTRPVPRLDLGAARNLLSVQEDLYHLAGLAGALGAFQLALPPADL